MADVTRLNAAIATLTDQVAATETVEASASNLLLGFSSAIAKAVTDALAADNAADQGSIDAAMQAIADTTTRFQASAGALGTAVAANTPSAPPEPPPSPPVEPTARRK